MNKLGFSCAKQLAIKASKDERIWVLDGDLADSDGAELFAKEYPERFIAAGIAEQAMVSIAAGMATTGARPWVFSFAAFLCYRAYDQIRVCISQSQLPVVLVGSHAGGCGGRNGKTHVALNDIAVMASLPNIGIWTPGDDEDVKTTAEVLLNSDYPAYIRLPRQSLPLLPSRADTNYTWIGAPTALSFASCGIATHWAMEAQTLLRLNYNIEIGILHMRSIWPLDTNEINQRIDHVRHLIVLDDHYEFGGLKTCLQPYCPGIKLEHWGWPSSWSGQSGSDTDLRDAMGLDAQSLVEKVVRSLTC